MTTTITQTQIEKQQVIIFKALADPIRLNILRHLKAVGHEVTCGEVGNNLNISKSSGSYHFKLLQEAQLITARKEAREKYVMLNPETFDRYLTHFFKTL